MEFIKKGNRIEDCSNKRTLILKHALGKVVVDKDNTTIISYFLDDNKHKICVAQQSIHHESNYRVLAVKPYIKEEYVWDIQYRDDDIIPGDEEVMATVRCKDDIF